jgi:hypothetical protein
MNELSNVLSLSFFLTKDLNVKKAHCWIIFLTARIMNSDLKIKRSEQAEFSHATALITLHFLTA